MNWRHVAIVGLVIIGLLLLTSFSRSALRPAWLKDLRPSLPVHPSRRYDRRQLSQIREIIVHHTAGPDTQTPEAIARYHVQPGNHICADGCPGIGYHFLIDSRGTAYQVNDLENVSYHVSGHNTTGIGISLIGTFDDAAPAQAQYQTLIRLIRWINRKLGRYLEIHGHREFSNKSCPGWMVDIDDIRADIHTTA